MKKWSVDLPHITQKQKEIMEYVFKFRFLDRIQLQRLIKHKDYKRINIYLKDLVEKGYLYRDYQRKIPFNIKPATYFLAPIGVRFVKNLSYNIIGKSLYKEDERSAEFRQKCKDIANLYLDLRDKTEDINVLNYFKTKQDFDKEYEDEKIFRPFPDVAISIKTSLGLVYDYLNKKINKETFFRKTKKLMGKREDYVFLMEFINENAPRYYLRHRIKQYIEDSDYDGDLNCIQRVCFILPNKQMEKFLLKFFHKELEETLFQPHIKFVATTLDQLRENGMIANIWRS